MLRVGIAVAGDLLQASVYNCLQDQQNLETCLVQDVSEIITLPDDQPLHALVLDDQFDQTTWLGALVKALKQSAPETAILVVGSFADGAFIYELLDAGADGYLFRGDDLAPLFVPAIEAVCAHKLYLSPTATSEYAQVVRSGHGRQWWGLDEQSKQVLRMLAGGKAPRDIASALHLKDRQVYAIRAKLRQRFQASTNEELMLNAGLQGYLRHKDAAR